MPETYILGIESSCDETAAAVVRSGEQVVSSVVYSQIPTHQPYGGVVPELASREHLKAIVPVVRRALEQAGRTYQSIDALAVTQGPGLPGSLLVGVSYAKALTFALDKPLVAVNHLEGHIHAVLLEEKQKLSRFAGVTPSAARRGARRRIPDAERSEAEEADLSRNLLFPVLALVVSGGHTHLYLAEQRGQGWTYQNIGHTRDDAAGEAYDKVAKLLALGYPGGPVIDQMAKYGDPSAVKFPPAQIKHRARGAGHDDGRRRFDFSFSGIKTAVLRYTETHDMRPAIAARRQRMAAIAKPQFEDFLAASDRPTRDLVASFQRAVVEDLLGKTLAAAQEYDVATLFVTGGVAANSELRQRFEHEAARAGLPVYFPSRPLSTDNAAMIAAAAYPKFLAGEFAPPELSAEASLPLN